MVNLEASTTGAKAANAEWFAADLTVNEDAEHWIVQYSTSAAVIVGVTYNSGTAWNNITTITVADTINIEHLYVKKGDLVNFRTVTVGGATVDICNVIKLED